MPDASGHKPELTTPAFIGCGEHGGSWRVFATRILTHTDGTRHRYAFARCGEGCGRVHEFSEYLWPAE